jgi:protein-disulfide isomerase
MPSPAWLLVLLACTGADAPAAAPAEPPATAQSAAPAAPPAGSCPDQMPAVVAEVGGKPITATDLESMAAAELIEARRALYEARSNAMESLIVDQLVDLELAARGMTEEQLVAAEVESKLRPPTAAEIQEFYSKNQSQMQAPLEQMTPQIAAYLEQQQAGELMRSFLTSLEAKHQVKRHLEPLRLAAAAEDSARIGPADAPITIIEYSDFQCPYCTIAAETVKQVREKYGDKVSVVYRHFPLPNHTQAGPAAEAAECANEQGQFWSYHDALFADQKPWTRDDLIGYAKKLDIKMKPFEECLDSGRHRATIEDDIADGRAVGMSGTPGFFVNGLVLSGAQPLSAFSEVIDRELARLGK